MAANAGAYREQDGQMVLSDHAQRRWDSRAPADWVGHPVRAAWREGTPVHDRRAPTRRHYARYHAPSGMILLAKWGSIQTALRADQIEFDGGE